MIFDKIVGHSLQVRSLKNSRTAQAYLFTGPSGIGKKKIALALAQKILCPNKTNSPCGTCSSCLRVEKISHTDLFMIEPEESTIKIESIRAIQNFMNLHSFEKHGKVVVIDDCQKMTPQSANALLKTLEEPPENSHFILLSPNKGAVLSTIQSRCLKINFGSLDSKEIKILAPEAPPWALDLCQGRMDLLHKWTDDNKRDLRNHLLKMFRDLPVSRAYEGFESLDAINNEKETALFALLLWSRWLLQVLNIKLKALPQGTSEEIETFQRLAPHFTTDNLMLLGEKILTLEKDIHANVNRKLAFENFWLDLKKSLKEAP